jgi:hypothetical protein
MISLLNLNKLNFFLFFILIIFLGHNISFAAVDIWEKKEKNNEQNRKPNNEIETKIENTINSEDLNSTVIKINESAVENSSDSVIGIFDPEENNFNLDMWTLSDGEDIKKVLKRIDKLQLSKLSEDILFQVLFTNAYPPKNNLSPEDFLKIKIDWLIKKKRIKDLEALLKSSPIVGKNSTAIKFLVNEYLSSGDIKSACEKADLIDKKIQNTYLEKFSIYCLVKNNQKIEAQLIFDLLKERGFEDNFFEDKINFLFQVNETTDQKIKDDNLLNFYLSHITSDNFQYIPSEKTDKYIWKYLSASNLIQTNNFEDENVISTYEQAAVKNSFGNVEIFKIYLQMNFSFSQLKNARDIYENLPNYKARALLYQSVLLSDVLENKIELALLLKKLFLKDQLFTIYKEELSNILRNIDQDKISEDYVVVIKKNLNQSSTSKVKFDNDILHRSKIIKHFLDDNKKLSRTEKDLKSVYKKIKKNKKYFISIKDIIVLESLLADGVSLPSDLNYSNLSSELTIPQNLQDLANQNQIGLVMLKIVEIVGEDNVSDLDPETLYFLNKILNDLNLIKIRNNILKEALPVRT